MKKIITILILWSSLAFSQITGVPHCGYDFTSYIVVHAHEEKVVTNAKDLRVTLVDLEGNEVVNTNNAISLVNKDLPLTFTQNYQVKVAENQIRWYFPYATDQYFLVVRNTIAIEDYQVKIDDPKGKYITQIIPLSSLNLYILCSSEAEKQARTFGPKTSNQMVDVVLVKK
ncbi:hypothetical protein [Flavobacterium sp.]|uniref:hypothetical protein n=1 Tax=Flavobacterium sp. TaxID=239 RepID=UPI0025B7D487|nr:hypothetical protein [Flavobacterium sp.]